MRALSIPILFILALSNLVVACGDNVRVMPDAPPSPFMATDITLKGESPPTLVVFRDGLDAPWQFAEMITPTLYSAMVQGSYVVSIVCEESGSSRTLQFARTRYDAHHLDVGCGASPSGSRVTATTADGTPGALLPVEPDDARMVIDDEQLSVSWTNLAPFDQLDLSASGTAMDGTTQVEQSLHMTSLFPVETRTRKFAIDTRTLNFNASWQIDFMAPYHRKFTTIRTVEGEVVVSSITEMCGASSESSASCMSQAPDVR